MNIDGILWLPDVLEKVAVKHGVAQAEAEDVFFDDPRYRFVETGYRQGEDVYAVFGHTEGGRYVVVFFILKPYGEALILSARDMDVRERRLYERK